MENYECVPTKKEIEKHNAQQRHYFERTLKRRMLPRNSRYLQRHVDELLRFGHISPGQRVLEVGCGMGRYTLLLAERGIQVEGLDLTPVLLDRLRSFDGGRYNISLHCQDILDPSPELKEKFDAVIGFFTLHHLHDLSLCFSAIMHFVKPGGCVVFLEPNPYNFLYYIQMLTDPGMTWKGDGGIIFMRPQIILQAMVGAGFGRPAMLRFGFFPPHLTELRWGSKLESLLEQLPFWYPILPFQIFKADRPTLSK